MATNGDIILAAINAAGDPNQNGYRQTLKRLVRDFTIDLKEDSELMQEIVTMKDIKPFLAILIGGRREASSTRFIVDFLSTPTEKNETGEENARTERTDTPDGQAMFADIRGLKNHVVLVYIEHQKMQGGTRTVRVIKHLVDQGEATAADYERFGHANKIPAPAEAAA